MVDQTLLHRLCDVMQLLLVSNQNDPLLVFNFKGF